LRTRLKPRYDSLPSTTFRRPAKKWTIWLQSILSYVAFALTLFIASAQHRWQAHTPTCACFSTTSQHEIIRLGRRITLQDKLSCHRLT